MAEKKEEPKVDNEVGSLKVKKQKEKQPVGNETKENVTKVKAKMTKPAEDLSKPTVTKVDLSKPKTEEDAVSKQSTDEVPVQDEPATSEKVVEEIIETTDEKSSGEGNAVQNETTSPVKEVEKVIEKSNYTYQFFCFMVWSL